MMRLHCFGESGNCYKVALALELADHDWVPVFVDFFNGETRGEAFRKLNPMGEAPVLEDGRMVISQSGSILRYLARMSGQFGDDDDEIVRWLLWDNHKFSTICGSVRFLANFVDAERRPTEAIKWLQGRLKDACRVLDARLGDRSWIVGEQMTIVDLSCCGYLFYPEPFGFDRDEWPNISRWLDRIASLPAFGQPYDLMPRGFA